MARARLLVSGMLGVGAVYGLLPMLLLFFAGDLSSGVLGFTLLVSGLSLGFLNYFTLGRLRILSFACGAFVMLAAWRSEFLEQVSLRGDGWWLVLASPLVLTAVLIGQHLNLILQRVRANEWSWALGAGILLQVFYMLVAPQLGQPIILTVTGMGLVFLAVRGEGIQSLHMNPEAYSPSGESLRTLVFASTLGFAGVRLLVFVNDILALQGSHVILFCVMVSLALLVAWLVCWVGLALGVCLPSSGMFLAGLVGLTMTYLLLRTSLVSQVSAVGELYFVLPNSSLWFAVLFLLLVTIAWAFGLRYCEAPSINHLSFAGVGLSLGLWLGILGLSWSPEWSLSLAFASVAALLVAQGRWQADRIFQVALSMVCALLLVSPVDQVFKLPTLLANSQLLVAGGLYRSHLFAQGSRRGFLWRAGRAEVDEQQVENLGVIVDQFADPEVKNIMVVGLHNLVSLAQLMATLESKKAEEYRIFIVDPMPELAQRELLKLYSSETTFLWRDERLQFVGQSFPHFLSAALAGGQRFDLVLWNLSARASWLSETWGKRQYLNLLGRLLTERGVMIAPPATVGPWFRKAAWEPVQFRAEGALSAPPQGFWIGRRK